MPHLIARHNGAARSSRPCSANAYRHLALTIVRLLASACPASLRLGLLLATMLFLLLHRLLSLFSSPTRVPFTLTVCPTCWASATDLLVTSYFSPPFVVMTSSFSAPCQSAGGGCLHPLVQYPLKAWAGIGDKTPRKWCSWASEHSSHAAGIQNSSKNFRCTPCPGTIELRIAHKSERIGGAHCGGDPALFVHMRKVRRHCKRDTRCGTLRCITTYRRPLCTVIRYSISRKRLLQSPPRHIVQAGHRSIPVRNGDGGLRVFW